MPKRILQDIIVPKRQSETPVRHHAESRTDARTRFFTRDFGRYRGAPVRESHDGGENRRFLIWGAAALALLFVLFAIFSLLEKATIKITPKQERASLEAPFSAFRGGTSLTGLPFEVMRLEGAEAKRLPTTEVKNVAEKASGEVTIFNNYNSQSQRLIKNTRFKTPEGLIYRIQESVVIPGQKKTGGETVPGSVTVTVYADEPGEKYNIGLTDFTIPGFSGTPRFDAFYARSKTPMAGGFEGIVKTVSDEKRRIAEDELKKILREKLFEEAMSQKPDDLVLYPDAVFISFAPSKRKAEADIGKNEVEIGVTGTLEAFIFRSDALSDIIGRAIIPSLPADQSVTVRNLDELTFTLHDKDIVKPDIVKTISFSLKGAPYIVWGFDEEALKKDTVGVSKDAFKALLDGYPAIQKAEVILRPFWKRSFPENIERVEIKTIINFR
ncbi:MAG: hypothetical protein AAB727_03970 [Patescibacteria group bacterium]